MERLWAREETDAAKAERATASPEGRVFNGGPGNETLSLDEAELEAFYAYPEALDRPWVRVNNVSSVDGAATVQGVSAPLSSSADRRVLGLLRDLSDVVLVGAGTAIAERYEGIEPNARRQQRRARLGLGTPVSPIAVVSKQLSIPSVSPLITQAHVPTLVLTCRAAPRDRRHALEQAGAEVIDVGEEEIVFPTLLAVLGQRGLRRICCEGGPQLFGGLLAAGQVDELCLSISPLLVGGQASRITAGPEVSDPQVARLEGVLRAEDLLLLRYRMQR